jgi:hypothetical protein
MDSIARKGERRVISLLQDLDSVCARGSTCWERELWYPIGLGRYTCTLA